MNIQFITGSNPIMPEQKLKTPVLLLTFNRPDTTQVVFNEIRKARPTQLFVAVDGPRRDQPGDIENCRKSREIIRQVDWDCKVSTLFRDENLGCKIGPSSAIDWFFSQVEEGIILEDDCVPDQSFFPFCQELLEKYRDDQRVMMISGNNFQFGRRRTEYSYYFSLHPSTWGWATWKRAWKCYDITMKLWPVVRDGNWLNDISNDRNVVKHWSRILEDAYNDKIDTWDYQWNFSCWIQGGLSIIPNTNLITNIGCNELATHTKDKNSILSSIPVYPMLFPLNHPPFIIRDDLADRLFQKTVFSHTLFEKLRYIMRYISGRIRKQYESLFSL